MLTEHVRDENAVEFGFLECLCELNPVVNVVEAPRFVLRVAPQAWGLVAAACAWGFGVSFGQGVGIAEDGDGSCVHIITKAFRMTLLLLCWELCVSDMMTESWVQKIRYCSNAGWLNVSSFSGVLLQMKCSPGVEV